MHRSFNGTGAFACSACGNVYCRCQQHTHRAAVAGSLPHPHPSPPTPNPHPASTSHTHHLTHSSSAQRLRRHRSRDPARLLGMHRQAVTQPVNEMHRLLRAARCCSAAASSEFRNFKRERGRLISVREQKTYIIFIFCHYVPLLLLLIPLTTQTCTSNQSCQGEFHLGAPMLRRNCLASAFASARGVLPSLSTAATSAFAATSALHMVPSPFHAAR